MWLLAVLVIPIGVRGVTSTVSGAVHGPAAAAGGAQSVWSPGWALAVLVIVSAPALSGTLTVIVMVAAA